MLALLCLLPALRYLPGQIDKKPPRDKNGRHRRPDRAMVKLAIIALISGMASAAWWSFGPDILGKHTGIDKQMTSLLWLISGGAGLLGILTGPLASRTSMTQVYRLSQLFMALPLRVLAVSHHFSWWLFPTVALSGAGYVTLSGVLLVCGACATPDAPASGVGMAFFMLAAGQIGGSVIFGQLYAVAGVVPALVAFAALSLLMMVIPPARQHLAEA